MVAFIPLIAIAGVISLPYAEIVEPFQAWFDLEAKSSRVDYYHGKKPLQLWLLDFGLTQGFLFVCFL